MYVVSRRKLHIEWGHCDPAGIVFNPRFFEFFDGGTWQMFETVLELPKSRLFPHYGLFGIPLVDAGADFKIPLKFGEDAEMESQVSEFRRSSFDITHNIFRKGAIAVAGRETRVWTGHDPNDPSRIRAVPIPDEVIRRFKAA